MRKTNRHLSLASAMLTATSAFPGATRGERLADLALHIVALALVAVGVPVLLAHGLGAAGLATPVSLLLYSLGLVASFVCSALYNTARRERCKALLQRFDHAAIFLLIAGTYTPFALLKIGDTAGWALLATVWGLALVGIVLKLAWPERTRGPAVLLYLGMGWSILFALDPLLKALTEAELTMLFAGGLAYTAGVLFFLTARLRYYNEIWHAFVLAGAICHYAAVFDAVVIA